jgi:hypothetical protein
MAERCLPVDEIAPRGQSGHHLQVDHPEDHARAQARAAVEVLGFRSGQVGEMRFGTGQWTKEIRRA